MGNEIRGVVDLNAGGTVYKVKFGTNAIVELEDRFDKDIDDIFNEDLGKSPRMKDLRLCAWAGLQDFQPELTEKDAGNIIDEAGIGVVMEALMKAIKAAYPEPAPESASKPKKKAAPDQEDGEKNANPPPAENGRLTS